MPLFRAGGAASVVLAAIAAPSPDEAVPDYRVFVDGRPVSLVEAPKPTKYWKGQMYDQYAQPYWGALFDAQGEVEVRVESDAHDLSQTRIVPDVANVGKRRAGVVTFKAKIPFMVSVEPQSRYRTLTVIAREPDRDVPRRDDPNVRCFSAGRYHLDEPIRLKSNDTLYLETGSFVEACVFASGTNIAIRGHGVLSGVPWAWKKGPQTQFVHFKDAKDVVVKDVALLGPYHWSLVLQNVEHAVVDGIAVLGGRVINDDGLDICRSRDVTIRNSFFHVQDDNIAVKWWAEDVKVENCVFWADVARCVHIGGECDPPPHGMRRISVKNVDVLHQSICKPVSGEPVIHVNASNEMPVEDVKIEGVHVWSPERRDMLARIETVIVHEAKGWAWYDKPGFIDGVAIRDVRYQFPVPLECGGIKILGHDAAHPVRNVSVSGINIEPPAEVNEHVENADISQQLPASVLPVSCIGMKRSWDPYPGWWEKRHEEKLAQIAASGGKIDIVFIGDSITHNWEGARGPGSDYGGKPLAALKKKYSVLNLGFGGDRTQNVLWRLENGELDGYRAKCFMLMIGTNNGDKRPEDTAAGVKAILDLIARKQPQAKTILLPVFPSGATADHPWRTSKEKINALIKDFADGDKVIWCDFNARFLNPDGTFPQGMMMKDDLHPLAPGYDIWAEEVTPLFRKVCGK